MITVDDVVDLIRQKADEDILKLGGVSGEGDLYLAAFKTARSRFGWLGINLVTAIMASIAIAIFETTIRKASFFSNTYAYSCFYGRKCRNTNT